MGAGEIDLVEDPRALILRAMVKLVEEVGYRAVTAKAIARTAGVTETVFRERFADEEECFLAAFDESIDIAETLIDEMVDGQLGWTDQLVAGLRACVQAIVAEPERARLCLIEAPQAGERAIARYQAVGERICAQLGKGRAVPGCEPELPENLESFLLGGLSWILQGRLAESKRDELPDLLPEIVQFALAPYLSEDEAAQISGEAASARIAA
jgi:AcrR family transcriptional regulator